MLLFNKKKQQLMKTIVSTNLRHQEVEISSVFIHGVDPTLNHCVVQVRSPQVSLPHTPQKVEILMNSHFQWGLIRIYAS